jgi:hypothetical protein
MNIYSGERRAARNEPNTIPGKGMLSIFSSLLAAHRSLLTAGSIALSLCLSACIGGTGVGTPIEMSAAQTGQVLGKVYDSRNKPVPGGTVSLVPAAYHAPSPFDTAAGTRRSVLTSGIANGAYSFNGVDTGWYNLEADNLLGQKFRAESLHVSGDTDSLPACSLRATGSVRGALAYSQPLPDTVFVYIPGTTYYTYTDSLGNFWFPNLPAGAFAFSVDLPLQPALAVNGMMSLDSMKSYSAGLDAPPPPVTVNSADTANIILRIQATP